MESSKKKYSEGFKSWFCKYNLLSVTLIAFGISSLLFLPDYIHKQIMLNLELRPDTRSFAEWKKPTVPLYFDIYIFNWTNPEDIKNSSTKPILNQIGPYRFREYRDKHNITFHNDSYVSYRKSSTFFFEPEMSNGTLDDVVVTVNLVAVGAAASAQYLGIFKRFSVSSSLTIFNQKLYVVKTAREMLFDGYSDSLLTFGSIFSSDPGVFDTVGFMVKKNASDVLTGKYTVHTGVDNISELGKIMKFNDQTNFPNQKDECSKLKGSPGEFYPPERQKHDILYLFTPEMCRSLAYEYESDKTVHGLKSNRYILDKRTIDNGTLFKENSCYFKRDMPSGVMNISECAFNQPFYISYPHFYLADSSYIEAVGGLSPQKELHQSYMTIDEKLSVTLEATARFQTNIMLDQYESISLFKNISKILMPLFFVEQKFIMNESDAGELYYGLMILSASKYAGFILIFLGIIFILCRRIRCFCYERPAKEKLHHEACSLVTSVNTV